MAGWWFQTCFIFHNIWDVILPIDELHHFSRWLKHVETTNQMVQGEQPCGQINRLFPHRGKGVTKMEEMRSGGYCDMGT